MGFTSFSPSNAVNKICALVVDGFSSNSIACTIMVLRITRCVFSWRMINRAAGTLSSSLREEKSRVSGRGMPLSDISMQDLFTLTLRVPTPLSFQPTSLDSTA